MKTRGSKEHIFVTIPVLIIVICGFIFVSNLAEAADPSKPEKKDGQCGPAAKEYAFLDRGFAGAFCSVGTEDGSPGFPGVGATVSWNCSGENGGMSKSCSASRASTPLTDDPTTNVTKKPPLYKRIWWAIEEIFDSIF